MTLAAAIETERLRLPVLTLVDCRDLDEAEHRRPEWAVGYPTPEDVGIARRMLAADVDGHAWGLRRILLRDGTVIGGIGIFGPPDDEGAIGLGYGLASGARGLGYATEAVRGVLAWAAQQGARVARADTLRTNLPSQAVLARAGFTQSGTSESDEGPLLTWRLSLVTPS